MYALRVACCDDYPGLMDECATSMSALHPGAVQRVAKQGCTSIEMTWKHWPCVFPQHGPGRKHEREIRPGWADGEVVLRPVEVVVRTP